MVNKTVLKALTKEEVLNRLLSFVLTDTLLFVPKDFDKDARDEINQALSSVNQVLQTTYEITEGLNCCENNILQKNKLKAYLEKLDDDTFLLLQEVIFELRSVLLGILFVEKKITVQKMFELAFFEELFQQKKWGKDEFIEKRHESILQKLYELEKKLK